MKEIKEVRSDYVDDQNLRHIDVFFDDDETSDDCKTIAVVDLDSGKVIFFDNRYYLDNMVNAEIKYIKGE